MKKELFSLKDILGKRISQYFIEIARNETMFETVELGFDDNTFIKILTPTRSELTERTRMDILDSIKKE